MTSLSLSTKYPKSYWDDNIIEYIGLKKGDSYYKNYIVTCLLNKIKEKGNYKYGRYQLDDELIEIFGSKLNTNYVWRYSSKSGISQILRYFRHSSKSDLSGSKIFTIDFVENGNEINSLSI